MVDLSSHDGFGGLHDNLFDIDFMENNQNDVGASRTKLPVHRKVEAVGVEFRKSSSQPDVGANKPTDPVLLLNAPVTGEPLNDPTIKASNSTFGDGLDLHEGKYFANKKELKNKLTEITLKRNFEF